MPNPKSKSKYTFTTALLPPPGPNTPLTLPTTQTPSPSTNPPLFNDALAVRLKVFVDEQKIPAEIELDEDDKRSWHWVVYDSTATDTDTDSTTDSVSQNKIPIPVAVLRLVPPPHAPHDSFTQTQTQTHASGMNGTGNGTGTSTGNAKYDTQTEPHIKIGRVAILPSYRGLGLAKELMETALGWAAENADEINRAMERVLRDEGVEGQGQGQAGGWKGLVLVHAQTQVEGLYGRVGFVTDEGLGRWIEDGIEHLAMWRRLDVV